MNSRLKNCYLVETVPELQSAIPEGEIDKTVNLLLDEILNKDCFIVEYLLNLREANDYTARHCIQVGILSGIIGARIGLPRENLVELMKAGLIHDYGKAFIPNYILNKPGVLSPEEFKIIKKHPRIGYDKLKKKGFFGLNILLAVLQHHEKLDGSGYPSGLIKISLYAQIVSIADIFDALTSDRPYHSKFTTKEAIDCILSNEGQFDETLVRKLEHYVSTYASD